MTAPVELPPDYEPSEEFNAQAMAVLQQWEEGTLPFREALEQMTVLGQKARDEGHRCNQGRVELLLGVMQGTRTNLEASIRHFERARTLFESVNNRKRAIGAMLNLGESNRLMGNFTRARQYFRAVYDAAVELGIVETQANALCNEGLMLISLGQYERARTTLEEAMALADKMADHALADELKVEINAGLAHLALETNAQAVAWKCAETSLKLATQINQPLQLGTAHRAMGEVLTALKSLPEDADMSINPDPDEHFRIAIEAFQEIKAEGEQSRTIYVHAMSLAARGKGMSAARKLQQAMILFTRLGMTDDAAKAARAQMEVLSKSGAG